MMVDRWFKQSGDHREFAIIFRNTMGNLTIDGMIFLSENAKKMIILMGTMSFLTNESKGPGSSYFHRHLKPAPRPSTKKYGELTRVDHS